MPSSSMSFSKVLWRRGCEFESLVNKYLILPEILLVKKSLFCFEILLVKKIPILLDQFKHRKVANDGKISI